MRNSFEGEIKKNEEVEKLGEKIEKEKLPFLYEIVQIDSRKPLEEQPYDFGIEVTLEGARNDLDHHGLKADRETPSACEQSLALEEDELPPKEAKIGILRPDADTLTALAVLNLRRGGEKEINSEIVEAVGAIDRLGPKEGKEAYPEQRKEVIAIHQIASERGVSINEKLEFIQGVLSGDSGVESKIEELVKNWENGLEQARKDSEIKLSSNG